MPDFLAPRIAPRTELVSETDAAAQAVPKRNYTSGGFMPVSSQNIAATALTPERSIFDETVGAAEYGAAGAGEALSKNIGGVTGSQSLMDLSSSLQNFKAQNPQYAPEYVDHWYNLITSPGALVSNVSAGTAQFAATAGALAIPYAGPALALGLTYGIESQNHYDDAIAAGAAPETAMRAARIGGAISAAVNLIPTSKLFRSFTGGKTEIARIAFKEALDNAPNDLAPELAHRAGMLAVANVLQRDVSSAEVESILKSQTNWASGLVRKLAPDGTLTGAIDLMEKPAVSGALSLGGWNVVGGSLDTLVKQSIYGENLPDFNWSDYLDQQAQSFLVGAATHAMMGIPLHEAGKLKAGSVKPLTFDYTKLEPDMVSKDAWFNQVLGELGEEQRPVVNKLMDAMVGHLADANGMIDKNEAIRTFMATSKQTMDVDGEPLPQSLDQVPGMYSRLEQILNDDKNFQGIGPNGIPASQFLGMLQKPQKAITAEELKWTGLKDRLTAMGSQPVTLDSIRQMMDGNYVDLIRQVRSQDDAAIANQKLSAVEEKIRQAKFDHQELQSSDLGAFPEGTPERQQLMQQLLESQNKIQQLGQQKDDLRTNLYAKSPNHPDIAPDGLKENFTEIIVHLPRNEVPLPDWMKTHPEAVAATGVTNYFSGHYSGTPNYLMDVSLGSGQVKLPDTIEPVKVRGIIEAQSDRAQQLRTALSLVKDLPGGQDDINRLDGPMMSDAKFWTKHLIKQSVLDAVERGYNYLALPDPEQVADRWHDRGEKEWNGLKTFYESIVNPIAEKLFRQYDPKHTGSVMGELVGGKDGQQLKTLEITPAVRQAVLDGQPLFQPLLDKSVNGVANWVRETAKQNPFNQVKGVLLKDGHIYVSDAEDHWQIIKALEKKGYGINDLEATLYVTPRTGERAPIFTADRMAARQLYGANPVGGDASTFGELNNPKGFDYIKGRDFLAQGYKGSTTFLKDMNGMTRAFVEMTQHADFSTPFHEMAHVLTKFSTPDEQQLMSKMVGKEWGHWGTAEWEKVAKGLEAYLINGKAPDSALQPFMDRSEAFMRDIYKNTRKSYLEKTLTPEALNLFDNWFVKDNAETKATRDAYTQSMGAYAAAEAHMTQMEGNYPSGHRLSLEAQEEYFAANKQLAAARELYKNALTDRLTRESDVDRWANATKAVWTQKSEETPSQSAMRAKIGGFWKQIQKLWSFETVVRDNRYGKEFSDRLNTAYATAEHWSQPLYMDADEGLRRAGRPAVEDAAKLKQADPSHKISRWTDLRRTEANNPWRISPPKGSGLSEIQRTVYSTNRALRQKAQEVGVNESRPGGFIEPIRVGENQLNTGMDNLRVPRLFSRQFRDAYATDPQVREEFKRMMATEVDPQTYRDPKKVADILPTLDGMLNNPDIRKSGSLEHGRVLELVPDGMIYKGKELPIFETHPGELLSRSIHSQTTRTAHIEQLGQGNLSSADISHYAEFANGVFDAGLKASGSLYREKLRAFRDSQGNKIVDDTTLDNMNFSQMKMLGKQNDIKYGVTKEEYINAASNFKASDLQNQDGTFDKNKVKKLEGLAKKLGGVTVKQPLPDLISEVRKRLTTEPLDVAKELRTNYLQTGGDAGAFDKLYGLAQGLNVYDYHAGPISKFYNNLRGVMGALSQGLVGVPYYATQAFNMAPAKATGLLDLFEAFRQTIANPLTTKEMMREFGVMFEPGVVYRRDLGLDGFGAKVYDFAYKYFGLKHVDDLSFGLSTRMAATWADRMNLKMTRGDLNSAARLRLSPAEIEQLQNHAMTPELKTKIVRGYVDSSLIYSSPQFKKGFLDTNPVAKMVLSYNSYGVGMARYMGHLTGEISDAIRTGDASAKAGAAVKLVSLVCAAVGASYAASVMSQALKLNATKNTNIKSDDATKNLEEALVDFGLLGPLMKMKFALQQDGGDTHNILSFLMPQFDTLSNVTAALLSTTAAPQGKYANYGFADRVMRTLADESPEWKIYRQLDQAFRTPEALAYNEAFTESEDFKDKLAKKTGIARSDTGGLQNPLVQPLYLDMRNLDIDSAQIDLQHYYNEMYKRFNTSEFITSGLDPEKIKSELKSSLLARAPLNMNPIELATFMNNYDAKSAAQMYKADAMYKAYVEALVPSDK